MGKSTRPVYWGRTVITGRSMVGDMLHWAPRTCSAMSMTLICNTLSGIVIEESENENTFDIFVMIFGCISVPFSYTKREHNRPT